MVIKSLLAAALVLCTLPIAAVADDYGPQADIQAIKHDLPIILSNYSETVTVTDVVVDRGEAMAQWNDGSRDHNELLRPRFGKWWLVPSFCRRWFDPPSDHIWDLASRHLPMMKEQSAPTGTLTCTPAGHIWKDDDGYTLSLFDPSDKYDNPPLNNIQSRAPTDAESRNTSSGHAYFFFTAMVEANRGPAIPAGLSVYVRFPFALDTNKQYRLIVKNGASTIGPLAGKVDHNALRFMLPVFTIRAGTQWQGEIDSVPQSALAHQADIYNVNPAAIARMQALGTVDPRPTISPPQKADSIGPHRDLRSIEHDLPIILAHLGPQRVDGIVVKGADAIAQTHAADKTYLSLLHFQFDRWWVTHWDPGPANCEGDPIVASDVYQLAQHHLPAAYYSSAMAHCTFMFQTPRFEQTEQLILGGGMFAMTLKLAGSDAPLDAHLPISLRAPTEAESWMARGGNSYFFFYADVKAGARIHVQPGTTIDVWFPFALKSDRKYSLTIGHTDAPIGPIDGTLKANTLHFVLPAFGLTPGAHLMGEIEANVGGE